MRLRAGAATDVGRVRDCNEDAYGLCVERGVFVVCDGMGGAASGEVASRMAVDAIVGHLSQPSREQPAGCAPATEKGYLPQTRRLADAVRVANERIHSEARKEARHAGMGTTVVALCIRQDVASVAHVGDSRAYLCHGGRLEALTRDHSLVEEEVRAGLLTRETSLQSERQNVLLRALGHDLEIDVDVNEVPVQPGDYLLLCTDGLTRMVSEDEMRRAITELRDPQRICDHLVGGANRNGGPDNITVIVVRAAGGWWQRLWDRRK